jgi:hypothetical protein
MIINSVNYDITYPFNTTWNFAVKDKDRTAGIPKRVDYGYNSDIVSTNVIVKGLYSELSLLLTYLQTNRNINIEFREGEEVFGAHIDHSGVLFSGAVSNVSNSQRINQNFWQLSFDYTLTQLPLKSGVVGTLDNIYFPADYEAGEVYLSENENNDYYGNFSTSYSDTVGVHSITFDMDEAVTAEVLRYMVETVRADGFTLTTDWQTLEPFAEKPYTHALLKGMSYNRVGFKEYRITLDLLGYNNG